jgi:DNA-binding GntR family transcriptional regulator
MGEFSMSKFKKLDFKHYKPLGEIVFDHLKESILKGELKPGERLMEIALAEEMGVSRTPVREAIRKLEKEKFVEMIPRKGAYVADLTKQDILEVLEIRYVLEGLAAKLAAKKMKKPDIERLKQNVQDFKEAIENMDRTTMIDNDNAFHDIIYEATENEKLIEIIQDLHDQYQRFRLVYFNEFDDYAEVCRRHEVICEAIVAGDEERAKEEAEEHVKVIIQSIKERVARS